MLMVVWISFASTFYSGNAENQHTRHERTRYVSSRNQIYGGNFDYNEKYIPFVHYWERPLQVLESSMKIPKKLSSRPLFSWDLPVQITSYSPSKKMLATENSVTERSKELQTPETAIPILKSRSGRAKALGEYPESFGFIPTKKKKSTNRKKSVESVKLKEFTAERPTSVKIGPDGKIKRKKKGKKSRKSKKSGKHSEGAKETNEVKVAGNVARERMTFVKDKPEVRPPCEAMEKKCEHRCKEVKGKAVCVCFRGFTAVGNKCQDVNECETNNGGCNGKCHNTVGSRKCICSAGFRLVDGACADINECLLRNGHGPCQDKCVNTLGSYYCTCDGLPGTELSPDKHTCVENNECNLSSAGCSHSCISVSGRAYCTCPDGMELGDDWKTCHDIDECSNPEDYNVDCPSGCINTVGSYTCVTGNGTLNYLEK